MADSAFVLVILIWCVNRFQATLANAKAREWRKRHKKRNRCVFARRRCTQCCR
jgi:hypothetical protein